MSKGNFQLRNDLPLPPSRHITRVEYPFAELQVGHCVIVTFGTRTGLMTKARAFAKANPGWKFKGRVLVIDGERMHGAWCTARPDARAANEGEVIQKRANERPALPSGTNLTPGSAGTASTDAQAAVRQQKLRDVAKLQPIGKRTAHLPK